MLKNTPIKKPTKSCLTTPIPKKKPIPKKLSTPVKKSAKTTPQRTMAQLPAGRKAFQTVGATQAIAPNPNTSKSQFRVELLKAYNRDGYVLVKNVLNQSAIDTIHNDMVSVFRGKYPNVNGLSPTTATLTDSEVLSGYSGIEHPLKVAEHARELIFSNSQISLALKALIGRNIKYVSSDYWIQGPGEYGRAWDQDESTIMTRDRSLVLAFISLDELTTSSGTILLQPASHKSGVLFPTNASMGGGGGGGGGGDSHTNSGSDVSFDWLTHVNKGGLNQISKLSPLSSHGGGGDENENVTDGSSPNTLRGENNNNNNNNSSSSSSSSGRRSDSSDHSKIAATTTEKPSTSTPPNTHTNPLLPPTYPVIDDGHINSVPVDMPAGSVLFINGYCLQRMMPTMSESTHRRLLRVHFCSAETTVAWNAVANANELFAHHLESLPPSELLDVRDIMMVAGNDPYEYKGHRNIFPTELISRRGPPEF
jgi:hypothetical protein